jgi:hypothetical protein
MVVNNSNHTERTKLMHKCKTFINKNKTMKKINDDLIFNHIEDNMIDEKTDKLKTVEMSFTFFGKHYTAYLKVDSIESGKLVYPMVEGAGKLLEAFEEELESEEVTQFVIKKVKEHILEYHSDED